MKILMSITQIEDLNANKFNSSENVSDTDPHFQDMLLRLRDEEESSRAGAKSTMLGFIRSKRGTSMRSMDRNDKGGVSLEARSMYMNKRSSADYSLIGTE